MKTVSGSLNGVDQDFRPTGRDEPRPLGQVNPDVCVRYLLGLPSNLAPGETEVPPTLTLRGKRGMWLTFCRREPGRILRLTMKDGEEDFPIGEIEATRRARLFVEHWGEDTELTAEVRLPPDVRALIAQQEQVADTSRRERQAEGPARTVFAKRTGLLRTKHEVVVDREKGIVTTSTGSRTDAVGTLESIRYADVAGLDGDRPCLLIALEQEERETTKRIGEGVWSREEAFEMAERVNDAIDLPESRRKVLQYRRAQRRES